MRIIYIYIYMDTAIFIHIPIFALIYACSFYLCVVLNIQSFFRFGEFIFGRSGYNNAQPAKSYLGVLFLI